MDNIGKTQNTASAYNRSASKNEHVLSEKVDKLFSQSRIKDALTLCRREMESEPGLLEEVNKTGATYDMMLEYLLKGMPDTTRATLIEDMRVNLMATADRHERTRAVPMLPDEYYAECRMAAYRPVKLINLLDDYSEVSARISLRSEPDVHDSGELKEREELLDRIFRFVWTMGFDAGEDLRLLRERLLAAESADRFLVRVVIGGLLCALMQWYDRDKFLTLLSIYESAIEEVTAADALVSLLLVSSRYSSRMRGDRKVMQRMEALKDSLITYRRLREVVRVLVRTRDTARITDKMRRELMPGMMQLKPDMLRKLSEATAETDLESLESNPEWEEMLEKSGIGEKMRELGNIQMDGGDVMMLAFSNLKNFPFFKSVSNWFIPFSLDMSFFQTSRHAGIVSQSSPLMRILGTRGMMCDSDSYSFMLALLAMPADQQMAIVSQFAAQGEASVDMKGGGEDKLEFDVEIEKYSRDIYRFYNLYRKHGEYYDPFKKPFDFLSLPVIGDILHESEVLELLAEFYFKRGYWTEAIPMLERLLDERGTDPQLLEKLGYSYDKSGAEASKVLECYMKAELFNPDSHWLATRLGELYARTGQWASAEEYMLKGYGSTENASHLLSLAEAQCNAGHWDEGLKTLYKADYLSPGMADVKRAIARAEIRRGGYEKGLNHMHSILESERKDADWRLTGHLYLLKGDYASAAAAYRHTIHDSNRSRRQWKAELLKDKNMLLEGGVDALDIDLLIDSLI